MYKRSLALASRPSAVLSILGVLFVVAAALPANASAGSGVIIPWALENENKNSNSVPVPLSQALQDAANFNFITAHPVDYAVEVPQMKAANPSLILLAYMNATFAEKGQGTIYPDAYYERDASGNKVINPKSGNYLMDPANTGWVKTKQIQCRNFLAQSGYDGCYLDLLGVAPLSMPFVSGLAINPATGQRWTQAQWLMATAALGAAVRSTVQPALVFGNGLSNGSLFFDPISPTKQLVDALDGGVAEAWLRGSRTPVTTYPTEAVWKLNVDMLGVVESEGKPLLTLTKLWVQSTQAQKDAWHQYAFASFLLGTQGKSAFNFSEAFSINRTTPAAWSTTHLGAPVLAYAKVQGVYQRAFANGRVLVNPTSATVVIALGGTYYTLARQQVTTVTLTPNIGLVLTKT